MRDLEGVNQHERDQEPDEWNGQQHRKSDEHRVLLRRMTNQSVVNALLQLRGAEFAAWLRECGRRSQGSNTGATRASGAVSLACDDPERQCLRSVTEPCNCHNVLQRMA